MPRLNRPRAIVLLIITAVIWSSSGLGVKLLDWGALAILSGRSMLAAGVMLLYLAPPADYF